MWVEITCKYEVWEVMNNFLKKIIKSYLVSDPRQINPSGAEARMLQDTKINKIAADALGSWVASGPFY